MCDFCEKFDFGTASCVVDRYGASIVMAGGSFRFPEHQQFLFCPKCGASRLKKEHPAAIGRTKVSFIS